MRSSWWLVAVLAVVGCGVPNYHRYVNVPQAPAEARAALARAGALQGLTAVPPRADAPDVLRFTAEIDQAELHEVTVTEAPPAGAPPLPPRMVRVGVRARVVADGAGSRVEVAAATTELLALLATGGTTYHAVDGAWWNDPLHGEITVDGGVSHRPGDAVTWRTDVMARAGYRLTARGGDGPRSSARMRSSLLLGVGLTFEGRDQVRGAFRPELAVSFDRQAVVSPMAGTLIPQGRRYAIDLSLAGLAGIDRRPDGAELGVTLHVPPYGGVYARAGYEWGDRPGRTYTAGVHLDTMPGTFAIGTALLAAVAYAASQADWDWPESTHQ